MKTARVASSVHVADVLLGSPGASTRQGDARSLAPQVERLDVLHREGALSDEEFATAKAKLLGSPAGPTSPPYG
jgi:hypothetical protein